MDVESSKVLQKVSEVLLLGITRPNNYIENNTWVRGNTRFISSVEDDIMFNTRNKLVFRSTHVFFCLLYKLQVFHQYKMSRSYDW